MPPGRSLELFDRPIRFSSISFDLLREVQVSRAKLEVFVPCIPLQGGIVNAHFDEPNWTIAIQ